MKLKIFLFSLLITGIGTTFAFSDVTERSSFSPAIQSLLERGVLEEGSFFRGEAPVPAQMFWSVVIQDLAENPVTEIINTEKKEKQDFEFYLKAAQEKGLLEMKNGLEGFNESLHQKHKTFSRFEALEIILKSKQIEISPQVSQKFKILTKQPKNRSYLAVFETAYEAGILEKRDLHALQPFARLKRKDFVQWIYNWHQNGQKKPTLPESKTKAKNEIFQYPYQKRRAQQKKEAQKNGSGLNKKSVNPAEKSKIKVQILNPQEAEKIESIEQKRRQDARVFQELLLEIDNKYKFTDQITGEKREVLVNHAFDELVDGLGDKYSDYIEPSKSQGFADSLNGNFEGIGAYVDMVDGQFIITAPIKGSPAEKAGILPGDKVLEVDGVSVKGFSVGKIIDLIKGPSGSAVTLVVQRKKGSTTKTIKVIRGKITIPPLKLEWKEGVPVIGVHQFSRTTGKDLQKMLETEVLPKNPKGIIFDLRNNPGGFLSSAASVGSLFLEGQTIVATVEYRNTKEVFQTEKNGILFDFEGALVFLQNEGSASASEILTGMVKDYEIGKIVGTASLGKGTVQEISKFSNGATLKLTVAKWLTPKGNWIHETGVLPDFEIPSPTPEEKVKKIDAQMAKALRLAQGKK